MGFRVALTGLGHFLGLVEDDKGVAGRGCWPSSLRATFKLTRKDGKPTPLGPALGGLTILSGPGLAISEKDCT